MKNIFIIFYFLLFSFFVKAQSLSSYVIASSGGDFVNSSGQLSFTTGETGLVSSFYQSSNILTQGFQQPEINPVTTFLNNHGNDVFSWSVFPNPTNEQFQLLIKISNECKVSFIVYNSIGQQVIKNEDSDLKVGVHSIPISLTNYDNGMYLVFLTVYSNNNTETFSKYIQLVK